MVAQLTGGHHGADPQVVDAVGDTLCSALVALPTAVVAAALMLGAEGVWVGSAFLASEEANIFDFQKQAIVDSTEEGHRYRERLLVSPPA